jgi:CheY-like chemotaxis protein
VTSSSPASCRVLVVEDESLVGMEIEDVIEELGH